MTQNRRFGWHSGAVHCRKLTVAHASSIYTDPVLAVGRYGAANALIDTSVVDNIFASINVRTATNKTDADTSCMALYVGNGNTADTINAKMQGVLSSMNIGYDVFDAYAIQGNFAISDTMATHDGNANLVAGAFKISIANGKTATGNVSALYLVTGDTAATTGDTATGAFDIIRMENNSTQVDSIFNIGSAGGADIKLFLTTGLTTAVSTATSTTISGDGYKLKCHINGEDVYIRAYKTA